jgi:hypothetical protein
MTARRLPRLPGALSLSGRRRCQVYQAGHGRGEDEVLAQHNHSKQAHQATTPNNINNNNNNMNNNATTMPVVNPMNNISINWITPTMSDVNPTTHRLVYYAKISLPGGGIRHAVYAESNTFLPFSGWLFQVYGNPSVRPMVFSATGRLRPTETEGKTDMWRAGWVLERNHFEQIREVCEQVPRPGPDASNQAPVDCEGWTIMAIEALFQAGVLEPLRAVVSTEIIFSNN